MKRSVALILSLFCIFAAFPAALTGCMDRPGERGTDITHSAADAAPKGSTSDKGTSADGIPESGAPESGTPDNGTSENGTPESNTPDNGTAENETEENGAEPWEAVKETLSEEDISELLDAGIINDGGALRRFDGEKIVGDHVFSRSLGVYNGCAVVVEDGVLQALWNIEVAGYVFGMNHSFQIYVCTKDEIVTLGEAYESGLLSVEDIGAVHEKFGGGNGYAAPSVK